MPKNQVETLTLTGKVELTLAEGTTPKLAIRAYSGDVVEYPGLGPLVIDISGLELSETTLILNDHQKGVDDVVGTGTPSIRDGELHLAGVANGITESSKKILGLLGTKPPTPLQASVGVNPTLRRYLTRGETVQVNGRTVKAGPRGLILVSKGKLSEVSITPLGVDGQTAVSIAASKGNKQMVETDNTLELARKQAQAEFLKIEEAFDALEFTNDMGDRVKQLKLSAFRGEIDYTGVLAGIVKLQQDDLKLSKTQDSRPMWAGPIHSSSRDVNEDVVAAALCLSLNVPKIEEQYSEQTLDAAHKKFRHLGLQETIDLSARANGYMGRGCKSDLRETLRFAFAGQLQLSGGPSNVSLPNILGAIANKELLAGFTEEDNTWREVAITKPVSNFHQHTSYRLLSDFTYKLMPPNGGFPEGRIDESQVYTRQVDTYGIRFELTRKDIVNDDLGSFNDLRTRMGRGAAKAFNNIFWQTFLDELATTFTSGNGNYISGSDTNLGTDGVGLQKAILKFWQMKSPSPEDGGKRIGGQPVKLIIPPELSFNADRLHVSTNLVGGSEATPEANIHVGRYRPVVVPFLSDSAFTGTSTTAWGLFRDPAQYACMVASFLHNQQTPTVESTEGDFDHLGIRIRAYHDFGADPAEIVAGVWSKGAN